MPKRPTPREEIAQLIANFEPLIRAVFLELIVRSSPHVSKGHRQAPQEPWLSRTVCGNDHEKH